KDGEFGKGKGMDGHAGMDLIVRVPCGTLVWKLNSPASPEAAAAEETEATEAEAGFIGSGSRRPLIRHAGDARALDIDLSEATGTGSPGLRPKGELVADLIGHGQRFVLCKGGRGGLGNRNF